MKLVLFDEFYSIYQVEDWPKTPRFLKEEDFFSVTLTDEEISVVCRDGLLSDFLRKEGGWRVFKIDQVLDLNQIGIIAGISRHLAENKISVFVVSTFNTDFILVKSENLESAIQVLKDNGYEIFEDS